MNERKVKGLWVFGLVVSQKVMQSEEIGILREITAFGKEGWGMLCSILLFEVFLCLFF